MRIIIPIICAIFLTTCSRTWDHPLQADVTTLEVTDISMTSAVVSGSIVNEGGLSVTERGFCYGQVNSPTIDDLTIQLGQGPGSFFGTITGLETNTQYYAIAYAINDAFVTYGNQISFSTLRSTLSDGLIAYFPFNGNADDESINNNNGIVHGPVLITDRFNIPNRAYNFDGTDDYIDIGKNIKPDFPFSISVWINPEDLSEKRGIFRSDTWNPNAYYHGFHLCYNTTGTLSFGFGSGFASSFSRYQAGSEEVFFSVGKWSHVVAVFTSLSNITLYLDSEEKTTTTGGGDGNKMTYSTSNGAIGNRYDNWAKGIIDDLRVYSRELTGEEVLSLYREGGWDQ